MSPFIVLVIVAALSAALLLVLTIFSWLYDKRVFEMDADGRPYSFHAPFAIYRVIYGAIFIFGVLMPFWTDDKISSMLLALSSVYSLALVLWLNFCYERYQHLCYRGHIRVRVSTYTDFHYSISLTLGIMAPLLFAAGSIARCL